MKAKSISRDEAKKLLIVALAKGAAGELEQGQEYMRVVKRFYSDIEISHMVTEILTEKGIQVQNVHAAINGMKDTNK